MTPRTRRGLVRFYEGVVKRRPVFRHLGDLEASQWWEGPRLEALRLERLRALLRHAVAHVPWYRALAAERGLDVEQIRSVPDLATWPILERGTITAHRAALRATSPGIVLMSKATGGSSGEPLRFDLDLAGNDRRMAAWHRGYAWAGAELGTRQWYLWGVPPDSVATWRKAKQRLYDALYGRTIYNCFDLATAGLGDVAASLARTRPDVIVGYTSALDSFARMLEEAGQSPFSPRSVVVGAEKLHDHQRARIERVFGAPVFETYGSREFMLMAAECDAHDGLHVTAENHIVEIVDDDGLPVPPGIEGDVLVTDLTNLGMPFIRYRNGDRAVAMSGRCGCGRSLPRLARISGRRLDILTTPDGRQLPGEFFPHILKEIPAVQQFQVVQRVPDAVTIRLVAPGWSGNDATWLRRELDATVARTLRIDIDLVGEIPLTRAGKMQVVVNQLVDSGRAVP
jgi:phenylacetate-CoA ligase